MINSYTSYALVKHLTVIICTMTTTAVPVTAIYTVSGKKGATLFLPVTLRNANRFSKFFHHHTLQ